MRDKNNHPKIGLSKLKHKALPLSIEEALKDEIPMDWSTPMIYGEEQVKRIPCLNRRYAVEVIEDEWSGGYVAIHPTLKGLHHYRKIRYRGNLKPQRCED